MTSQKYQKESDLDKKILQDFHGNEVIFKPEYKNKLPTLDKKAQLKILSTINDDSYLRVSVIGGGCSGFTYSFEVEDKKTIQNDDLYISVSPTVVIDPVSAKYMPGSIIKWVEELTYSTFEIENPGAQQSCGCGSSFSYNLFKEWES